MGALAELLRSDRVTVSCEVFPPREALALEEARRVVGRIAELKPAYVSVTCGAGGTDAGDAMDSRGGFSLEIARRLIDLGATPLTHVTCLGETRGSVSRTLDALDAAGVGALLALRGDRKADGGTGADGSRSSSPSDFPHASDLIAFLKARGAYDVGAACYPEGHPESPSRDADLDGLRRKADAGADFLTTQMFFDNNILYNFMFRMLKKGVDLPVAAGVFPVVSARQIRRVMALSGASLPPRFAAIVDRFKDDPAAMRQAGIAFATEQIVDLIANGVTHVHLYTMNRPEIAAAIFRSLSDVIG